MIYTRLASVVLLPAVLALAGCGNAGANRTDSAIAIVNGERITLLPDDGMAGSEDMVPSMRASRSAHVLEQAVDQTLLVQRALAMKLDRSPQVAREMEQARRRILAQAYLRRAVPGTPVVTPQEVQDFYRENPALFAERRVFVLQELTARLSAQESAALDAQLRTAGGMKEVARWLRARAIPYQVTVSTRAAEQLPVAMLGRLSSSKSRQIVAFVSDESVSVIEVLQSHAAPLTEEQAAPLIERHLAGGKRLQRVTAEIGKLRQQASIEYPGQPKELRALAPLQAAASGADRPVDSRPGIEPAVSGL
ncbi:MAG: EpsD family peptidyl-prolyl cis-trans isomerase [Betaproteobacteria bacterium]